MEKRPDVLDVLRILNPEMIEENPQIIKEITDSLTVISGANSSDKMVDWQEYSKANAWTCDIHKQSIIDGIMSQRVEDKEENFVINSRFVLELMMYFYALNYFRMAIPKNKDLFAEFKDAVLWGLILKHINGYLFQKDPKRIHLTRLNKSILTLGEHIFFIPPNDDVPDIIDKKFLGDLLAAHQKGPTLGQNIKDLYRPIVMEFIQRVFGGQNKKARYHK